jgi:hypothetical protein
VVFRLPGAGSVWNALTSRFAKGSTGGPDAGERARGGSHIVGIAYDEAGQALSEVHVTGIDGYTFTGRILAWGAEHAAGITKPGALGPVEAFGLRELERGCAEAGLVAGGHDEAESARGEAGGVGA